MKVHVIVCPKCGDKIYSRARHDFRYCTCKGTFIDGGFDYIRCGGSNLETIKHEDLEIKATKEELYKDWNTGTDKYGLVKGKR